MEKVKTTLNETGTQKIPESINSRDTKITAPEGAQYLGDWMEKIPENCVLSKGTTGCGATTLATVQRTPTLITVPFTELIRNKAAQFPENSENKPVLLPIYGEGDKTREIADYMQRHGDMPKIITTYDSVPKVCRTLDSLGYDPFGEMHLCVDE